MFRPRKEPSVGRSELLIIIALLVAVMIATSATIWMAIKVRNEQRTIENIVENYPERAVEHLKNWQVERSWELTSVIIDVLVLASAGVALFLLSCRFLSNGLS